MGSDSGKLFNIIFWIVVVVLIIVFRKQVKQYIVDPYLNAVRKNQVNSIQVDAWGAFVPGRGNIIDQLKQGVISEVQKRQINNLLIEVGSLSIAYGMLDRVFRGEEPREYIFFVQKLGGTAQATLALRIARRGALDMELSWRLFESNLARTMVLGLSQGGLIVLGFCIAMAGLITSIFGFGVCVIPIGVYMMGIGLGWWGKSKGTSQLTPEQKLDSRILAQSVDFCLMHQLDALGVSSEEIRVLQAAQMEGIGRL